RFQCPIVLEPPVQIPHVPEPPVQIPVSQVPQSPVADSAYADSTYADSTYADSTYADSTMLDSTYADSTYADSACADSRCSGEHVQIQIVTSPTATFYFVHIPDVPRTCADSIVTRSHDHLCRFHCVPEPPVQLLPEARYFGPLWSRQMHSSKLMPFCIWTPRTPAASHGTLYF
ncbi:hypothetical protein TNCV_1177171, partial [Trichonephila clavipes]